MANFRFPASFKIAGLWNQRGEPFALNNKGLTALSPGQPGDCGRFSEEALLRRTQRIVLKDEEDTVETDTMERETVERDSESRGAVGAMRAEIERAFTPVESSPLRRGQPKPEQAGSDTPGSDFERISPAKADRRQSDRRGMDALRDEALRNLISRVEDKNFGGLRDRVRWGRRMKPSRIALLLVAVTAGGLAAFLSTQRDQPATATAPVVLASMQPAAPEIVKEARTQILVARQAIGVGQRLTPASVEWVDWPQGAVRPEYITVAAAPEAITDMSGSVARLEFVAGEPIHAQKLAQTGEGVLAAVLGSGMRGVSVSVAAESASGGFIVPDDRVDVVVTRSTDIDQVSETILFNVRVLAINAQLGAPRTTEEPAEPTVFTDQAIATLELDADQAEMLISASTAGKLSLVLRSILDTAQAGRIEQSPANQAIRISSPFWAK
jgi:pilus assembly protein CpaB